MSDTKKHEAAPLVEALSIEEQERAAETDPRVKKLDEAEAVIENKRETPDARGLNTQSAGTQMNSPTAEGEQVAPQFGPDKGLAG